jgi:dienelactone hydrolase
MFGPPVVIGRTDSICNPAEFSGIEAERAMSEVVRVKLVPLLLLAWISSGAAQTFHISPSSPILVGEPLSIRVDGLPADQNVTLTAERTMPALYRSQAVFLAPQGTLDLATAKPLSGTYAEADIHGLFWSMAPVADGDVGGLQPLQVKLSATADGRVLASATIEFIDALPAVEVEEVKEFPGAVFATLPGPARRPALIVLGGSEGGGFFARDRAPRFASRGFAVLGLPYYSPGRSEREIPDLPAAFADIPVDRLNTAFEWLQRRPEVDASRVALLGASKGAEFVLIAASRFKWITSAVAVVPSDVVWEGWGPGVEPGTRSSFALNGKPLPFVPYLEFAQELDGFRTGRDVRMRRFQDKGRAANPAAAVKARIEVEKFRGPLLVIGGHDDQVWASGMMAQNIAERRAAARLETVALIFPEAGHALAGNGWLPTTQYNVGASKVGGTPQANAAAQARAFPETIEFLKRTLRVDSDAQR